MVKSNTLIKNAIPFSVILLLLSFLLSCSSNSSVVDYSDKLIGDWVQSKTTSGDGYELKTDFVLNLKKSGEGSKSIKMMTSFTMFKELNNSYTLNLPVKWVAGYNGKEDFLILKYGSGIISDIVAADKKEVEKNANITKGIYSGISDTLFFTINKDESFRFHLANSDAAYKMSKR